MYFAMINTLERMAINIDGLVDICFIRFVPCVGFMYGERREMGWVLMRLSSGSRSRSTQATLSAPVRTPPGTIFVVQWAIHCLVRLLT